MRPEPESEQDAFKLRPLPSVDLALLPHERRAERVQRWVLGGIGLIAVLAGLGVAFGPKLLGHAPPPTSTGDGAGTLPSNGALTLTAGPARENDAPAATQAVQLEAVAAGPSTGGDSVVGNAAQTSAPQDITSPAATSPIVAALSDRVGDSDLLGEDERIRTEQKFGSAKSFSEALVKAGATRDEANELIAALQKLVDFRRGKPEHTLILERSQNRTLQLFEYRAGITEIYRATRARDGKLRGEKLDVPIEHRRIAKGTQVVGSLGQSLAALGLGPSLAGAVIEAFDAKISFKKDTRAGDAVKLIVDEEYVDGKFLRYGNVLAVEYAGEKAGKLQAFWFDDEHGGDFYDPQGRAMHGGWLRTPLRYDHVSSGYNLRRRHPILKRIVPHQGIDYSAGTGTPVWAAADGVVTFAGVRGPNGNLVSLKHGNGYESHYAHLWRIATGMKPGTRVKQRQVIGYVGTTGRSTGPHLHFALKRGGRFLDPATQLNGPGLPLPSGALARYRSSMQRLRAELERIPLATPMLTGLVPATHGEEDASDEEVDL